MSRRERSHPKEGDWVVLKGDDIIACDNDPRRLMELIISINDDELLLSKQPSSSHCYYYVQKDPIMV
ncbi:MAG: hypothetical protein JW939_02285 [Candidatus Thermoplasmatota archaeon]|nr:hypothetical protein [Candidatus Thermoplasmatota archaeon]